VAAIFISHSSRDNTFAGEVKAWLDGQHYEQVFLDFDKETGLDAGKEWERHLYEAIRRCHAAILLVTPEWSKSKWCFVEFAQARALGKVIFPVLAPGDDGTQLGPVLDTVQAAQWDDEGRRHLARRLTEVAHEIAKGHHWTPGSMPWPGIMSFEYADAAVFFGRHPEIRLICERLETRRVHGGARLVLIVGASGSGKSSVLKAGVLPYLDLERDHRRFVTLPAFRPGSTPVLAFAKALAEALGQPAQFHSLADDLRADPEKALVHAVEPLRIETAREATVLVAIDQFEELFLLAPARERDALMRILTVASAPVMVVGTVRSDLLGEMLKGEQFSLAYDVFTLANLPHDRIRSVIEGPAEVAAVTLGEGLADRILGDVGTSLDALPLLAFTLRTLYERGGQDKKLTVDDYEALGDREHGLNPLENAVRRIAEETLAAAAPSPQELAALREAFVGHLVRVNDEGVRVRRPALLKDLGEARRLIDKLADARLLSTRTEGTSDFVEVAHEALFKVWPDLASWLDANQNFLIGLRQIEDAERQWAAEPAAAKDRALLAGLLLENAREWWRLYPKRLEYVRDFVIASIDKADREEAREKRTRRFLIYGAFALAAIFAVIGSIALVARDRANAATATAVINETRALAALGETAVATGRPIDGLKLGLAAWPQTKESERRQLAKTLTVLSSAISDERLPERIMRHESGVVSSYMGALPLTEGRVLSWANLTLRIWDVRTGAEIGSPMSYDKRIDRALLLDDDHVLAAYEDQVMYAWDVRSGKRVGRPMIHWGSPGPPVRLGNDEIVSWSSNDVYQWTWRTGEPSGPKIHHDGVRGALVLPGNKRLLSWSNDGSLRMWDRATGNQVGGDMRHGAAVNGARILPNGRLLSWSQDKTLRMWDSESGASGPIMQHEDIVWGTLDLPGGRLISWSNDKTLRLWDTGTGKQLGTPMRHGGAVGKAIKLSNTRILSLSTDLSLRIWDVGSQTQVGADMRHTASIEDAQLLPDGRILSLSWDRSLRVWDANSGQPAGPTMRHDGPVLGAMTSSQGLLSWSLDGTLRLWRTESVVPAGSAMHPDVAGAVEISGDRILSWSGDGTVHVWNGQNLTPDAVLYNQGNVTGAMKMPDGRVLLWGDQLRLWDLKSQPMTSPPTPLKVAIQGALVLPPEGSDQQGRILSWSADGTLRLWNALDGQPITEPMVYQEAVREVTKLPHNRLLVRGWQGLQIWNASDLKEAGPWMPHKDVVGARELPNGRLLSWSSESLKLWNSIGEPIPNGERKPDLYGPNGAIVLSKGRIVLVPTQAQVMPVLDENSLERIGTGFRLDKYFIGGRGLADGQILSWSATGGGEGMLQVWDPDTQRQVASMRHAEVSGALELTSRRILSWSRNGALRLWQLNLPRSSLFELSCALLPDKDLAPIEKRYSIDLKDLKICGSPQDIPLPDWKVIELGSTP
jgi:WD40 repeat protein